MLLPESIIQNARQKFAKEKNITVDPNDAKSLGMTSEELLELTLNEAIKNESEAKNMFITEYIIELGSENEAEKNSLIEKFRNTSAF